MCSEDEIFDDRADFDAQLEKCMSHVPKLKSLRFEMAYDDDRGQYYVDARMLGSRSWRVRTHHSLAENV